MLLCRSEVVMLRDSLPVEIPPSILAAFEQELQKADLALSQAQFDEAWSLLSRAHVLGQAWNGPHARVHVAMIRYGLRRRQLGLTIRQVLILLFNPLATALVRRVVGASGQNVNPLQRGPVPSDLAQILREGVAAVH
jgi:hypothetical protein